MENNFDLKKYDKKVALNYNFLSGKNPEDFCGAVYFLYGETCHFCTGRKFPENGGALLDKLCDDINEKGDKLPARSLAEAVVALCEYGVAANDNRAILYAGRAVSALLKTADVSSSVAPARDAFPEWNGKTDKNAVRGIFPHENDVISVEINNKCFIADAFAEYCCIGDDENAKLAAEKIINEFYAPFKSGGYNDENAAKFFEKLSANFADLTPEGLLRLTRGALNYALFTGDKNLKVFAAGALDYCLVKGLCLNYAVKNSFGGAKFTSAAATSAIFSLCLKFYKITGDNKYSYFARRIWYNGLQFCQRIEGGAGEDSAVSGDNRVLQITRYLSDRDGGYIAEALAAYIKNKQIFAEAGGEIIKDKSGRILMGDKIFVRDESGFFGKDLIEIPTMTAFDKDVALQLKLKI